MQTKATIKPRKRVLSGLEEQKIKKRAEKSGVRFDWRKPVILYA
jgi:hypothetical protein